MLAAAEFLLLSLYFGKLTMTAATKEGFILTTVAKSTILFLSGAGAACVAHQVKTTILRSLTAIEKENKTANLFGQQISKEVVQKILESDGALQSRLMNVCVMFIDIRNFTRHVDGKTPIEIVEYQNAFFKIVIEAVIKHHGIINQFLGDGCMVTFGAPVTLPNPCANAVAAAVEIKNQLSKENRSGVLPFSSIGIGIHTGDAVTGNIGTKERQQYSITGSVVILASRIEQLNKQYNSQILISENVVEMIPENIKQSALFLGRAELKGWHDRIAIYKVA
jgi:adenylate cyclase